MAILRNLLLYNKKRKQSEGQLYQSDSRGKGDYGADVTKVNENPSREGGDIRIPIQG